MLRRYEHPNGRYWQIDVTPFDVVVGWGLLGEKGLRRNIVGANVDQLIDKQLERGYELVADEAALVAGFVHGARWSVELTEGSVANRLEISVEGLTCTIRDEYKPVQALQFASFVDLRLHVGKLVHDALDRGYKRHVYQGPQQRPVKKPEGAIISNPELEAECRAAPEDPGPWLVYADWLEQQQDPRGRIAALSRSGQQKTVDREVKRRFTQLFPGQDLVELTKWRHGFPVAATLPAHPFKGIVAPDVVVAFLALPVACFIEELRVGGRYRSDEWKLVYEAAMSGPRGARLRVERA